jgi:hypothetical protein
MNNVQEERLTMYRRKDEQCTGEKMDNVQEKR